MNPPVFFANQFIQVKRRIAYPSQNTVGIAKGGECMDVRSSRAAFHSSVLLGYISAITIVLLTRYRDKEASCKVVAFVIALRYTLYNSLV